MPILKKIDDSLLFTALLAAIGLAFLFSSLGAGIIWDEWMDSNYGMLLLRFFLSGGQDQSFMDFWHGYLYCEPLYMLTGLIYGTLQTTSVWNFVHHGLRDTAHLIPFYTLAHLLIAASGFLAVLFSGLLAKKIAGWRAGILAILFLSLSPRFLGNSFNNPKDIPFAAFYIAAVYFMTEWFSRLPAPPMRFTLGIIFSVAMAIWVRVGGLLLIAYFLLFSICWRFYEHFVTKKNTAPASFLAAVFLISLLCYLAGLLIWPYGLMNPITHPLKALFAFSSFGYWDNLVLFEGALVKASALPWYYLPKWILISSPLFFSAGFLLFIASIPKIPKDKYALWGILAFTGLFPVLYVILRKSIIYDAWRHMLFVYPPLCILAAAGWYYFLSYFQARLPKILACIVLFTGLVLPFRWIIQNHPNEYVYFNEFTGGLKGAFVHYESDYWGNCVREGAEWLGEHIQKERPGRRVIIRADGSVMNSYPYLKNILGDFYEPYSYPKDFFTEAPYTYYQYSPLYLPALSYRQNWDYAITLPRTWPSEHLKNHWPPPQTIYEVKADNVTLCAVVENPFKK